MVRPSIQAGKFSGKLSAVASTRALIHAPWSASKVAMALRCPRLFHYRYVDRIPEPEVSPEARIGKAIHEALEHVLEGTPPAEAAARARAGLADEAEGLRYDQLGAGLEPFARRIDTFRRRRRVTRQLVEYSLAVREDLSTTAFYAGDAYYRGILDAGYLFDEDAALLDHKTGARWPGTQVADQLEGYAVLAAAAFPRVRRFWLGIHWVSERAVEWGPPLTTGDVKDRLEPGLLDNIEAAALAVSDGPRPNPGPYCDRCAYRAMCPAAAEPRFEPVEYDPDDD